MIDASKINDLVETARKQLKRRRKQAVIIYIDPEWRIRIAHNGYAVEKHDRKEVNPKIVYF